MFALGGQHPLGPFGCSAMSEKSHLMSIVLVSDFAVNQCRHGVLQRHVLRHKTCTHPTGGGTEIRGLQ